MVAHNMPMLLVEVLVCTTVLAGVCYGRLLVKMTLVAGANKFGAVCLDGSLPAYHLDRGLGSGANNWILQFEGGGWCGDIVSCMERSKTRRGSTLYMNKLEVFSGILSNNRTENPDFYNWNRVKLRYCDGASFGGDSVFSNGTSSIYFRGQRIWKAIILDLLPKGLNVTPKVLLSGCSAGGLATFLHCDDLAEFLPKNATLKCMSDAGFFLNVRDISGSNMIWPFFDTVVTLHGVKPILNRNCTNYFKYPSLCFFPQNALAFMRTPYFILNSAYDIFQFHHIFVPPSSDPYKLWSRCQLNLTRCNPVQLAILQVYRYKMLGTLTPFEEGSRTGGLYINSCFAHCQSELQDTWFGANSPRINNKTIAEAVGDWYFSRKVSKEIDCPYPCDNTCVDTVTL